MFINAFVTKCHHRPSAVGAGITNIYGDCLLSLFLACSAVKIVRFILRHGARIVRAYCRRVFNVLNHQIVFMRVAKIENPAQLASRLSHPLEPYAIGCICTTAADQVIPAPKETSNSVSVGLMRPQSIFSASASGIDAADVLA